MHRSIVSVLAASCSLALAAYADPAAAKTRHHRSHHHSRVSNHQQLRNAIWPDPFTDGQVQEFPSAPTQRVSARRSRHHHTTAGPAPVAQVMWTDPFVTGQMRAVSSTGMQRISVRRSRQQRATIRKGRVARITRTDPFIGRSNASSGWIGSDIVAEARRWIGPNPTNRHTLWCARFMNFVLKRSGHPGTGSDMARSFASYGHRISGPRVGAIAVMARGRRGGHVGVVSGIDEHGNPIIISGNYRNRVEEAVFPRRSVFAYVMPNN